MLSLKLCHRHMQDGNVTYYLCSMDSQIQMQRNSTVATHTFVIAN